jgi:hypothetical protein
MKKMEEIFNNNSEDYVVVNRNNRDTIAKSNNSSELARKLLELEYDSSEALILNDTYNFKHEH